MSDDWAVGDLALCVDDTPCHCGCGANVELNRVYRVSAVVPDAPRNRVGLLFDDVEPGKNHIAFGTSRFRKVKPDEHTDCEPEFIELLKRSKAPSPKERETRILEALFPSGEPK